ncbi:MAG: hypothetical protein SFU85_07595 [Candidatus Methylacidiphilales bacterium]|nr:hypothetical protein [Candidatus Methylacidiphilales bacterium]
MNRHLARKGGILKSLLLFLGGGFLLLGLALAGLAWYVKTRIESGGGLHAMANRMAAELLTQARPALEKALPPGEENRLNDILDLLQRRAPGLTEQQSQSFALAVEALCRNLQDGSLSESDARTFLDELSRLLAPPADVLDSGNLGSK